jgi:anti-sigma factor RsiW
MTCEDVQSRLHDLAKRRVDPALRAEIVAHVEGCATCASAQEAEQALDAVLERRLPRYAAPPALKRRLGLLTGRAPPEVRPLARWRRAVAPAIAAGLALFTVGVLLRSGAPRDGDVDGLTSEIVNDHLRVLATQHPVDVESGGSHQVKPWFEGKLDFAPVVPALEGTDVRLRGGAVGYVFDRKAAVLVYQLRLHVVTLLVFRADGLDWRATRQLGPVAGHEASARGFNAVLWRRGGLGYAVVSDVNASELSGIAARMAAETADVPGR